MVSRGSPIKLLSHFVEEIGLPFDKCFKEMMNKIVKQLSSFIS